MDLLFLGTSSGTPTRSRNVSGLALVEETGKRWYLIDCGEATQHQLLRTPLSLHDLNAIFITHVHGDHCYGLPGLLASAGMAGRREPLEIIAPLAIEQWIADTLEMSRTHLPFELRYSATESLSAWRNRYLQVQSVALSHRVPSHGYVFTEARPDPRLNTARLDADGVPRGPLWGQLARGYDVEHHGQVLRSEDYLMFTRVPRRIVVGGDNDRPELLREACIGAQVLVHEATYAQALIDAGKPTFGHSTAADVARFAESVQMKNLVLTHFSPRYQLSPRGGESIEQLRNEAATNFAGALFMAQDLDRFRLGRDGVLRPAAAQPLASHGQPARSRS